MCPAMCLATVPMCPGDVPSDVPGDFLLFFYSQFRTILIFILFFIALLEITLGSSIFLEIILVSD